MQDRSRPLRTIIALVADTIVLCALAVPVYAVSQWASTVIGKSSEWSSTSWSAAQALGQPNTFSYGDIATAWAPRNANGALEYLTVGFSTPVYATGVTIRETDGNGFVYRVDAVDVNDGYHQVWSGADPSQPGAPVDFLVSWSQTSYLVKGVRIYVNTNSTTGYEEIDAVRLAGQTTGNAPPTVTMIGNRTVDEDTPTGEIEFTVGDAETPAESLTLSGSSSNQTLVPDANIWFGGGGAERTVAVTPAANQSGSATIAVTVSDGIQTATSSFVLTVTAVNDPPTAPSRLLPMEGQRVSPQSAVFRWTRSTDVDGDQLTYRLHLQVAGVDSDVAVTDTTVTLNFLTFSLPHAVLPLAWTVMAEDGALQTPASNGTGHVTIDSPSVGRRLPMRVEPDYPVLLGEAAAVVADLRGLAEADSVVAVVDTNGVALAQIPHFDLRSASGSADSLVRGGFTTLPDLPHTYRVSVEAWDTGAGAPAIVAAGQAHVSSTNLRIEDPAGTPKQIFTPGNTVRIRARTTEAPVAAIVDRYGSGTTPPGTRGQVAAEIPLVASGPFFTGEFGTEGLEPADYAVMLLVNGTSVPLPGAWPYFSTDPIPIGVGSVADTVGGEAVLPVWIGAPSVAGTPTETDDVAGKGIVEVELDLTFDTSRLAFQAIRVGEGSGVTEADHSVSMQLQAGRLVVTCAGKDPLSREGVLYWVRFRVVGGSPGETTSVQVERAELQTDAAQPLFAALSTGSVMIRSTAGAARLPGDINHSRQVTALDAILILRFLVGLEVANSEASPPEARDFRAEVADVNRDGRISPLDAALILQYDAGIIAALPAQAKPAAQAGRTVSLGMPTVASETVSWPVVVNERAGAVAGELELAYDAADVEIVEVTPTDGLPGWQVASEARDGRLWIAFAGTEAAAGAGELVRVETRLLQRSHETEHLLALAAAVLNDGQIPVTVQADLPTTCSLSQNSPNPFNPVTTIRYQVPKAAAFSLKVYDLSGQAVAVLVNGQMSPGLHSVVWNGQDQAGRPLPSGVYFCRLESGRFVETRKMAMVK